MINFLLKSQYRVGKLCYVLMLTIGLAFSYGQALAAVANKSQAKLELRSLKQALAEIEKKYRVTITYTDDVVSGQSTTDDSWRKKKDVESAIKHLLEKLNLTYIKIGDNNYVIKLKAKPSVTQALYEQSDDVNSATNRKVDVILTGTVIAAGDKQETLPGVSVKLKGSQLGTTTDAHGKFKLLIPATYATGILVVSYVGFVTREIPVPANPQTPFSITLNPDQQLLEEIVVVGYGTQKKSDLTGAITQVKGRDLNAYPVINPVQGLQGKAAGVQVMQNSGEPGKNISVRIRGGNSLRGSNEPLYVVDGFALAAGTNSLNPADIESMEILKDASATAIYGSRGANGVILITTKKGAAGKSTVNVDSYYGMQTVIKKLDMLNAREFAEVANQRAKNDGLAPYFTDQEVQGFQKGTDWQDELFRSAPIQNHSLTFAGGSDKTQYSLSASYFGQQGIILGSGFNRGSIRANINHKVSEKITLLYNNVLSRTSRTLLNSDNGQRGSSVLSGVFAAPPTMAPYNPDGTYATINGYGFSPNVLENPLALALARLNTSKENYILSNLKLNYEPIKGLSFKFSVGIENNPSRVDFYSPRIISTSPTGTASLTFVDDYNILNENIVDYVTKINDKHSFTFTGGFTYQNQRTQNSSSGSSGFASDVLQNNALASGSNPRVPTSSISEFSMLSYLGRINYAYNNKYLFTVSNRADGSSRFGNDQKWGYFPSAAVAWKIKEEDFLKNNAVISDLKLRTSWGKTGSTALAPYQTLNTLNNVQVVFNDQLYVGFAPGSVLPNPKLKWETTTQMDIGADLGILNNRFQLNFDLYNKNTSDLLAVVSLPTSYGYSSIIQNIGSINNKGFEIGLNSAILSGAVTWNVNANISANRNKVTRLADDSDVFGAALGQPIGASVNLVRVGYPVGVFYGYLEDGLDNTGQIKFKDLDNNGLINSGDKTIIGDPNPDFIYGINSSLSFRNFEFNFFIQGVQGADIFNYNKSGSASSFYFGENQIKDLYNNSWTPDNPNAKYPIISSKTLFKESDRFVENGSYVRLKSVQLAYNFKFSGGLSWIKNAQVYLSGQNLLTLSNYSWYDPEINSLGGANSISLGIDQTGFPNAKTVTIGTRINF